MTQQCESMLELQQRIAVLEAQELATQKQLAQQAQQLTTAQAKIGLLTKIVEITNLLLKTDDYNHVLPQIASLLGEAVESNRCSIIQEDTAQYLETLLGAKNLPFRQKILQGEPVNFLIDDTEAYKRQIIDGQEVTSILLVPILITGQLWGQIIFEHCGEERLYNEAEIAILKIGASCIATGIKRQAKEDKLRKSEQRFRELFETSNDGVHFIEFEQPISLSLSIEEQIDLLYQGRVREANAAFAKMYGFNSIQQIIGKRLDELHSPDSNHRLLLHQMICNGWSIRNIESDDIDEQGKKRYWLSHLFTHIENGYAVRGWAIANNITEFKQIQQALLKAEQARSIELEQANRAIAKSLDRLAGIPELGDFLCQILLEVRSQLGAKAGHLFYYDPAAHALSLEIVMEGERALLRNQARHVEPFDQPTPADITEFWQTLITGRQPLWLDIDDPKSIPLYWPGNRDWHRRMGNPVALCVPLLLGQQALGFLGLTFKTRDAILPEKARLVQVFAHQATLAIQLTRLAETARQEAQLGAVLEERNRIAREIHDTLAQYFTGISMQVKAAKLMSTSQPDGAWSLIDYVHELASKGLAEARRSVWALHPDAAEYREFLTALERTLQDLTANTAIYTKIQVEGTPYPLECDIGRNLLRVAQEAITNCLRHAQATKIIITVQFNIDSIYLKIQDNGCGFDAVHELDQGGFGLLGMQQRCSRMEGKFSISSQYGQGTCIKINIPISNNCSIGVSPVQ